MNKIENQVTDVEIVEDVPAGNMNAEAEAYLAKMMEKMMEKMKPAIRMRAITEYLTEDGKTRSFIDYKKLERNKYAPWGRGEFA